MIKYIDSKQNNKVKHAYSLKESKYRKEYKEFLAEGKKALDLALFCGNVKEIFTLKEIENIPSDITQYIVGKDVLDKIALSGSPEGIVFVSSIVERKPKILNKVVYLDSATRRRIGSGSDGIADDGEIGCEGGITRDSE